MDSSQISIQADPKFQTIRTTPESQPKRSLSHQVTMKQLEVLEAQLKAAIATYEAMFEVKATAVSLRAAVPDSNDNNGVFSFVKFLDDVRQ